MDERKKTIRELEDKMMAGTEARNRLFEGLGEALFVKIGDGTPFPEESGNTPGGILADYRTLQKEVAESEEIIKGLEADVVRLKELEESIFLKEKDQSLLEKELDGIHTQLGKTLLKDSDDVNDVSKSQEEDLLARIGEQEKKLEELEGREGGILSWLGKSAQIAVSRTLLLKNRTALQRIYRTVGKTFLSGRNAADSAGISPDGKIPGGETAGIVEKALELSEKLSSLAVDLAMLKGERRNMGDVFGPEGSPARRIMGLQKHISHVKGEYVAVYHRFGLLAAESKGREALTSILTAEDYTVLEKAESLKAVIARDELEIEKIKASISIDNDYAEIEKMKKNILGQKQKIAAAEEAVADLEKSIARVEEHIEGLKKFIGENE